MGFESNIINLFILSAVFCPIFLLMALRKKRMAISLCLFLLPYNYFAIRYIGVNYVAIAGLTGGYIFSKLFDRTLADIYNNSPYKKFFFFICVSYFISLFLFIIRDYNYYVNLLIRLSFGETFGLSAFYFSIYFVIGIIFYNILFESIESKNDIIAYIKAFCFSISYIAISWIGFSFNIKIPFFLERLPSGGGYDRFSGFWGDYELTNEYLFIVAIFSLLIIVTKGENKISKGIALLILILSLLVASYTGTRSIIIMILTFSLTLVIIYTAISEISIIKKVSLITFTSLAVVMIIVLITQTHILGERISMTLIDLKTLDIGDPDRWQKFVNRNYTDSIQDIIESGKIFGLGPIFIQSLNGDGMIYHCNYFNIMALFGLFGITAYFLFWGKLIKDCFRKIIYSDDKLMLIIIFSLFISLLVDQIKVNYMREPSHMLSYWFIYAIISVVNLKYISVKS